MPKEVSDEEGKGSRDPDIGKEENGQEKGIEERIMKVEQGENEVFIKEEPFEVEARRKLFLLKRYFTSTTI